MIISHTVGFHISMLISGLIVLRMPTVNKATDFSLDFEFESEFCEFLPNSTYAPCRHLLECYQLKLEPAYYSFWAMTHSSALSL